jgi:UDP-glucuronate 4-epimerase
VTVWLTGAAGFIGYHVASALLDRGDQVVGVDNLNPYYDVALKRARLARLVERSGFAFEHLDISDRHAVTRFIGEWPGIKCIVHLAAQAGVRYSLVDPYSYVEANVLGQLVIAEAARRLDRLEHLVYASSSSVYGANATLPFSETDRVDQPLSVYAASKRAGELMAEVFARLYGLPQTGLRFFTVYGPWGRPDMAYYMFARAILADEPITVYDDGALRRDFTFIDDVVTAVLLTLERPPPPSAPARLLNVGNRRPETVTRLIALLEQTLGRKARIVPAKRPLADVMSTFAATDALREVTGFAPSIPLDVGVPRFAAWFQEWRSTEVAVSSI